MSGVSFLCERHTVTLAGVESERGRIGTSEPRFPDGATFPTGREAPWPQALVPPLEREPRSSAAEPSSPLQASWTQSSRCVGAGSQNHAGSFPDVSAHRPLYEGRGRTETHHLRNVLFLAVILCPR